MTQSSDLFEGTAICPSCRLEHRLDDRFKWSFPWGVRLSKCPRCLEPDIDLPEIDISRESNETAPERRPTYAGSFHHD